MTGRWSRPALVEAGVDLSFRSGWRERFSAASLIQVGGRVNRHSRHGAGVVTDFLLDSDEGLKAHPGAARPAAVLGRLLRERAFDSALSPADLVTRALREEHREDSGQLGESLAKAERQGNYPWAAEKARLIDADTRLVVVKPALRDALEVRRPLSSRELLAGSVQLWMRRINELGLVAIAGRPGLFWWPYHYEADFLDYMRGALELSSGEAFII